MADSDRIVFPEEVVDAKAAAAAGAGAFATMADSDRIVFPEEVVDAKAAAAAGAGADDTNSLEVTTAPNIGLRNMIQVPDNCPEGSGMDEKGVCREVF